MDNDGLTYQVDAAFLGQSRAEKIWSVVVISHMNRQFFRTLVVGLAAVEATSFHFEVVCGYLVDLVGLKGSSCANG